MIDLIKMDADHVLGVRIKQNLLSTDIDLAMNMLRKKIRTRDHIALYAEIEDISDVEPGVLLKEIRYSLEQVKSLGHIDRAAVVTENKALRESKVIHGIFSKVRFFSNAEKDAARDWVSQPLPA